MYHMFCRIVLYYAKPESFNVCFDAESKKMALNSRTNLDKLPKFRHVFMANFNLNICYNASVDIN